MIIAIDGRAIDSVSQFAARMDDYKVGSVVKLTIWRDGQRVQLTATLQSGDDSAVTS